MCVSHSTGQTTIERKLFCFTHFEDTRLTFCFSIRIRLIFPSILKFLNFALLLLEFEFKIN